MSKLRLIANKPLFDSTTPGIMRIGILPARKEQLLGVEATNVVYDKVSGAITLQPVQLSADFNSKFTGQYTRLSKLNEDFVFLDDEAESAAVAAEWGDTNHEHKKNTFLWAAKNSGGYVRTKNDVGKKRGYYYRFTIPPSSGVKQVVMHLIFGKFYKLDVYSNGLTVLYSRQYHTEYLKVGQGYLTGSVPKRQTDVEISNQSANMVTIVIMPIKHNCLYIHSPSLGGSWTWTHQFSAPKTSDVPGYAVVDGVKLTKGESILDNIIGTAPMGFKSEMPTVHVQMMPLTYPASGLLKVSYMSLVSPPPTHFVTVQVGKGSYQSRVGYSFNEDADYPVGSDIIFYEPVVEQLGNTNSCVITCMYKFKSDSMFKFTPMLYNHTITFEGESTVKLVDESTDITHWDAGSMSLSLTNDASSRQLSWKVSDENTIRFLHGKMNIPISLQTAEGFEIFYGLLNAPSINPNTMTMDCTANDLWKMFDNVRFGYEWVADGLRHTDIVAYLLKFAGIPRDRFFIGSDPVGQRVVDYRRFSPKGTEQPNYGDGFRVDTSTSDEPLVSFKPGSTVSEALRYINETYTAQEWTMGFFYNNVGKVVFSYIPNTVFDETEVIKFVNKTSDIVESNTIDGITSVKNNMILFKDDVFYKYKEPEATTIRVIGSLDGSSNNKNPQNYIVSEITRVPEENRALPVAQRSVHWVGERRYYAIERSDLSSSEMCNYVAVALDKKLGITRVLIEFSSFWNAKIFPGVAVWLAGIGYVRIKSMNINFDVDNEYVHDFPTSYMGELIQ